jgi:hypothetical protein
MRRADNRIFAEPLEPRTLFTVIGGVDPNHMGKGDWVWEVPSAQTNTGTSTVQAFMNFEKSHGMSWVTVKAGDGATQWSQFDANLVAAAHNAGLKVFAWAYAYGSNVSGETAVATHALSLGADGFIIDAETEYENLANPSTAATSYASAIKASYPNKFLAYAPFPIIDFHTKFPYLEFGKYSDAVMPQDYWADIGYTPAGMVSNMDAQWSKWQHTWATGGFASSVKPIVPIGQGYSPATGAEITSFVNDLRTDATPADTAGYGGVSFWSAQHHDASMWSAMSSAVIPEPSTAAALGAIVGMGLMTRQAARRVDRKRRRFGCHPERA